MMRTSHFLPSVLVGLIFIVSFGRCSKEESPAEPPPAPTQSQQEEIPAPPAEPTIYRTTVDELRLRDAAGTDSRVIKKLPIKQKLYSLDEASTETFTATLGGSKVTDFWRKVKLVEDDGNTTEGWVFGGGLREIRIEYELMPNGKYVRDITDLPGPEMGRLLELDVDPYFAYAGRISYRKTPTGLYLPDGPFEVVAKEEPNEDGFTKNISITYLGQFLDGKLDGEIQRLFYGYESESKATIHFRNGQCDWGMMREEGEGMVNVAEEKEMGSCTFSYLEENLRPAPTVE